MAKTSLRKITIKKSYRRQYAIGTPSCSIADHQTKGGQTVAIRYRDTMQQERVAIDSLKEIIGSKVSFKELFEKILKGKTII